MVSPGFNARYKGRPLFDEQGKPQFYIPQSGLSYSSELEWFLAGRYFGYQPTEFDEIDTYWQARVIAAYRSVTYGDSVSAYEQTRDREWKAKHGS